MSPTCREIARRIDHAVLSPASLKRDVDEACETSRKAGIASVCVRPCDFRKAAELLDGSQTAASTVIGFPHGGSTRAAKVAETREAIEDVQSVLGSGGVPFELDMVINIGRALSDDWGSVRDEIQAVRDVTRSRAGLLKVIFETGYLDEARIRRLCELCGELHVDFVKTSTGFGPRGASIDDVRLMRECSPPHVRIKASGGIRSLEQYQAMVEAGADRIGTSHTKAILDQCTG